jgi:diguanylate cyclase (GGDEF)-like protein
MKQRNGAGSKRLVEATERFIRSEQKLLEVLGERRILKKAECAHFAKDLSLSASKKRSSDVFASAVSINRKLMGMLSKSRSATVDRTVSDSDVLGELSRVTQTGGDPIEAFRESLLQIRAAIPFENATLFLVNRQSQTLEEVVSVGGRVDLIGHVNFDRGKGFSSWVAQQRKPVLLNDLHREEGPDAVSLRSFLSVPILVQSEVIGVVNMCHSRPGAFDEESVKRLELMTIPISAIAIRMLLRRERERLAAKRYGHKVSVVVLDVDGAAERKGRTGHGIGDQILSDMGRLLKRSARGTDCVARYEGDEFRILLPHTDAARAKVAAERLRGVVEQHAFPRRRRLTVHVGVATYPVDGVEQDPASLRASAGVPAAAANGASSVPAVDELNETIVN